jgi:hypothetical protein
VGGADAIAKASHLRRTASGSLKGRPFRYTEWFAPDRKYRSESIVNDIPVEEVIHDGERAARRGEQGQEELADVDLQELVFFAHPVPEADMQGRLDRMVLAGRTTLGDREAFKVVLMTQHGTTIADYFDAENGLLVQRVEERFMAGRNVRIVSRFSDHAEYNGLLLPKRIVRTGHPAGRMELVVDAVSVGPQAVAVQFATGLPPVVEPAEYVTDPGDGSREIQNMDQGDGGEEE